MIMKALSSLCILFLYIYVCCMSFSLSVIDTVVRFVILMHEITLKLNHLLFPDGSMRKVLLRSVHATIMQIGCQL